MTAAVRSLRPKPVAPLPLAVTEIGKIHFEGNIIPHPWYQRITLESGKPDLPAIIILAEIIYWYRPIQSLDQSGKLILRKRFDSDMFQCSAAYFEAKFGFTKTQARRAIARLEEMGLIRREFRDVVIQGILRNNITFIEPVPVAIMAITHPPTAVAEMVLAVSEAIPLVSQTPSPVGETPSPTGEGVSLKSHLSKTTTETTTEISTETTTTTTPNPSASTEHAAEPEAVERGGRGVQNQNPKSQDSDQELVTLATTEQNPASQEEAQTVATTEKSSETTSESQNPVASAEEVEAQQPELTYPAKLTEREREDITAQIGTLPPKTAQQMLDVIEAKRQAGQIKTNPAAVLRGIMRKHRADSASFDPSIGFSIADARHRRAEFEARQRAEAERREREREASRITPAAREVAHRSLAAMKQLLRGHA